MENVTRTKDLPTQALVVALVVVLLMPGMIFTGVLLKLHAASERQHFLIEARDTARYVASAIDRDVGGLINMLRALSTSAYLTQDDLEKFHKQASNVKALIGEDIGLRLPNGQQVVNTRVPWGTALPITPLAMDEVAIATRKPTVSDVFIGRIANRPLFAVILPVIVNDEVKYLLHAGVETMRLAAVIESVVQQGWLIEVSDRNSVYVARSQDHREFVGRAGMAAFRQRAQDTQGSFVSQNPAGEEVFVGFTQPELSSWIIYVSTPKAEIERPLWTALWLLIGFGLFLLLAASLMAVWLWGFISRPLATLASASRHIGQRDVDFHVDTPLREFSAVSAALTAAAEEVRATNESLEATVAERTQALENANEALKAQIAARESAECQIRQLQKMEAVGQLTGGIAHDFNNMLSIVTSALGLLQIRLRRGQTNVNEYIEAAFEGVERATALTQRLLAFSRQQPLAPQTIKVNELADGMLEMLRRTLGETIHIDTVLADDLWRTHADALQIENAILNLAVNARDAMPDGGRLTIETANALLDDSFNRVDGAAKSKEYVLIAVTDTGIGMTADTAARAFDPFFTTKQVGMGTGLGLSQVYGFVKQSNGHIKIYSEPGQGTTIKIYLPRYCGAEEVAPVKPVPAVAHAGDVNDVILVVEDEDRLRRMTVDTLNELGYSVFSAGHAKDALAIIDAHPEISLLFTDIMMPDINGRKLADEAVKRISSLAVIFTTGFTRSAVVKNGILDAGVNFIAKPFSTSELAAKIREVLAQSRPSATPPLQESSPS